MNEIERWNEKNGTVIYNGHEGSTMRIITFVYFLLYLR